MSREIGFAYIKSEGMGGPCEEEVYQELVENDLTIEHMQDVYIDLATLRRHQPILFDLRGNIDDRWKTQGAQRLADTAVRSMLVSSEDAIRKCHEIKMRIREKYAQPCEFDREKGISYPNYMHASTTKGEVDHDVGILLPEQLGFVRSVNGLHLTDT